MAVTMERVEQRLSTLGLKIVVSTRSTGTENRIFKGGAMKNNMHYSKQYTTDSTNVKFAALVIVAKLF